MDRSNIIYHWDLEQGSEAWELLRLGKFTGTDAIMLLTERGRAEKMSMVSKWLEIHSEVEVLQMIITEFSVTSTTAKKYVKDCRVGVLENCKDDGLGEGAIAAIYEKAAQLIVGKEDEHFGGNGHTERGNEYEPLAIELYEENTWETVKRCGFVELFHYAGFSPDGFVGEKGMIEVKAPAAKEYLRVLTEKKVDKKYTAQMQYGLWISGREWCDNIYFNPKFHKNQLTVIRVERDEQLMQLFEDKMTAITERMDTILNQFN